MDRSDVFLSYRRVDVDFAKKLYSAIKETGRELWVDWEDIPPGVEGFSDEIQRGIEGADAFICILSPSYLESEYCLMELREAIKLKKRVIPLVLKKFEPLPPPEGIGHINWVYFTPHAGQKNKFEEAFPKVVEALEADYEHAREHTRVLLRAIDWDKAQRAKGLLLKDAEIEKAEHWQVAAINKNPAPIELQGQYILTSRTIQRQQQRRFTAIIGILLGFAVLATIFAGFQWNSAVRSQEAAVAEKNNALTQQAIAVQQRSTAQAAEATAVVAKNDADTQRGIAVVQAQNALISGLAAQSQLVQSRQLGILLGVEAYHANLEKGEIEPAVQTALRSALVDMSGAPVQTHPSTVQFTQFSPDGSWLIASSGETGQVQISDLREESNAKPVILTDKGSFSADTYTNKPTLAFSPDNQWLAGIYSDYDTEESGVWIWSLNDLESGPRMLDLPDASGSPMSIAFGSAKSDPAWLAVGLEDGNIYTWNVPDLPDAQATLFVKDDQFGRSATGMVFSPDGIWLAVAYQSADPYYSDPNAARPTMLVWDIKNKVDEPIVVDLFNAPISLLTFSDSGKWLGGASNKQLGGETILRLWNMRTLTKTDTAAQSFKVTGINNIAFSSDDRWVSSVGGTNAEAWNLNGFSRIELPGYKDIVLTVDFSPDGQWLVTGDYDGQVRFWRTSDLADKNTPLVEAQARTFKSFDVIVNSLDFNSGGTQLAVAGDQQVRIFDLPLSLSAPVKASYVNPYEAFGNLIVVQDAPDSVYVMDLSGDEPAIVLKTTLAEPLSYVTSPDRRYLAVAGKKQLQVWDLQNPAGLLFEKSLVSGAFASPSFTADTRWFVYGVYNEIFVHDLQQKPDESIKLVGNRLSLPIVAFTSAKGWLFSQSRGELLAWDTASALSEPVKLLVTTTTAEVVSSNSDSKWLLVQDVKTLKVWNVSDLSEPPLVFEGSQPQLFHDRWLLTFTLDNEARLWDLSNPDSPVVTPVDYGVSESQNWFYYFDDEYTLWLLDLRNAKQMKVVEFDGAYYYYPTISADDNWLAITSADGRSTLLYDLTKGLSKSLLPDVTPLNFSPDGRWLALQNDTRQNMLLYDLQNQKQLDSIYPNSNAFEQISPDGRWAIGSWANSATDLLLIDLNNPENFYKLTGHTDEVGGRSFTPDGRWLLTYGYDGTVRIWDLEKPAEDPVIFFHENLVSAVQFSENNNWLISATDKYIYVWQWDFIPVHELACRLVGRNLTEQEWANYIGGQYQKTCEQWP